MDERQDGMLRPGRCQAAAAHRSQDRELVGDAAGNVRGQTLVIIAHPCAGGRQELVVATFALVTLTATVHLAVVPVTAPVKSDGQAEIPAVLIAATGGFLRSQESVQSVNCSISAVMAALDSIGGLSRQALHRTDGTVSL